MTYMACTPKFLSVTKTVDAARTAIKVNPANQPNLTDFARLARDFTLTRERAAIVTSKYWGKSGVNLTVGFMDNPSAALRKRILLHMNSWNKTANVNFVESKTDPVVRIARVGGADGGYWSYVGTDVLHIPKREQTMNLDGFTMDTPDSEFYRVVRHETGHTIGMPHEHMRRQVIRRIDREKAFAYFGRTQGWSREEVMAQVLTALEDSALIKTPKADETSIMCYQMPAAITKDGKPILGGRDINATDFAFIGGMYPKAATTKKAKPKKAKPRAKPKSAKKPAARTKAVRAKGRSK